MVLAATHDREKSSPVLVFYCVFCGVTYSVAFDDQSNSR
jgi:hypothetical protein